MTLRRLLSIILALVLPPHSLFLMLGSRQVWILGLLRDQIIEPVQQAYLPEQGHQVGDVHVRDCARLELVDGGNGNPRRLGQVSLGKVHHQPVILEPQSKHLQDLGVRISFRVHSASIFVDANVINYR